MKEKKGTQATAAPKRRTNGMLYLKKTGSFMCLLFCRYCLFLYLSTVHTAACRLHLKIIKQQEAFREASG